MKIYQLSMKIRQLSLATALASAAACSLAAVSAEEAAKLKTELTPFGAERAGNKDGSIPPWTGGYTTPIPGDKPGGRRGDPFKSEKPLFSITAKNMDQYAAKLTDGQKAMLKKHPDTYRLDIYPTHRTAVGPQWVYDNTMRNATQGTLVNGSAGPMPDHVYGGIPFPFAKNGTEVMWNYLLRWRGDAWHWWVNQYLITPDGKRVLASENASDNVNPYYQKTGSAERWNGEFYLARLTNSAPPFRAGEALLARLNANDDKTVAWVYLVGQRRVRKLPNPCCDTPATQTAGIMTFDELEVFTGRLSRFDWELLGKREMYIPYNSNRTLQPEKDFDLVGTKHLNPDHVRWELHRVWVVEAKLKSGQRHASARSLYYIDEDTWDAVLADRWDGKAQLSRTLWKLPMVMPDVPAVTSVTFGLYDLLENTYYANGIFNSKSEQYKVVPGYGDSIFTPDALASDGAR